MRPLLQPKVETMMATAIATVPHVPTAACIVAVATLLVGRWSVASGSVTTYARLARR
jgi:hypothetical protein